MLPFRMYGMSQSIIIGVLVHILMLYSVFDIYFVSPIYQGMTPYKSEVKPPAKRVVLFVADGLRASSLFGADMRLHAPYLSSIVEKEGAWGISHTQVPTESRPGHIALLAGFNEDPSAVTKGWRSNPVDFDSVINQSSNAWCWGSPDIVDMFNKDNLPYIHIRSYDPYLQDFSGINNSTIQLDLWVFSNVRKFIYANKGNRTRCKDLCDSGNFFFLHLLGLDTAGHSIKPISKEYKNNIRLVDKGIMSTVDLMEKFFYDQSTAYFFTSDHGMTDWGSHGDGSKDETEVPFVVWGAGILPNTAQQNFEQINIAPLLSSLIGINIPINNLGVAPLHILNASLLQKASMIYANTHQLGEQFIKTHVTIEKSTLSWTFQPYPDLSLEELSRRLSKIEFHISLKEYKLAISKAYETITLCKQGIQYYRNYYQKVLLVFVTIGFIGWLLYLFISIIKFSSFAYNIARVELSPKLATLTELAAIIIYGLLTLVALLMFVQSLPLKFYIYCILWFTWIAVARGLKLLAAFITFFQARLSQNYLLPVLFYAVGIEILVVSFFVRGYMSILLLYYLWKFYTQRRIYGEAYELVVEAITIAILAGCPLVLHIQTEFSHRSLFLTIILWIEFNYTILKKFPVSGDKQIFGMQCGLLYLAFFNTLCVNLSINNGYGLLLINQIISWSLLVISPILPLIITTNIEFRILSVMISLMVLYTLMAVGFEHLFMHLFIRLMRSWASTEYFCKRFTPPHTHYATQDYRMIDYCFFLLIFIMFGYFGVGNTASMNSFDPMWVRCFVTVFSPFTMAGLILIKLMIPFLVVLCGFRKLITTMEANCENCFLILLLFCDIMVIQFLFFVKNEGSWLDIGVSLSRFVVVNITTIVIILLYQFADVLATFIFIGLRKTINKYFINPINIF